MMSQRIEDIRCTLYEFDQAEKAYNDVTELVELSSAIGHSDGRWQPILNINYQVTYQKSVGSYYYHKSECLNREIHKLISADLNIYLAKALNNIKANYEEAKRKLEEL